MEYTSEMKQLPLPFGVTEEEQEEEQEYRGMVGEIRDDQADGFKSQVREELLND